MERAYHINSGFYYLWTNSNSFVLFQELLQFNSFIEKDYNFKSQSPSPI